MVIGRDAKETGERRVCKDSVLTGKVTTLLPEKRFFSMIEGCQQVSAM